MKRVLKIALIVSLVVGGVLGVLFGVWLLQLNQEIKGKVSGQWFNPPTEFYAAPQRVYAGQVIPLAQIESRLLSIFYRKREETQRLRASDFSLWDRAKCQGHLPEELAADMSKCLAVKTASMKFGPDRKSQFLIIVFGPQSKVLKVYAGEPPKAQKYVEFKPQLFAQFYQGKPVLQDIVEVSQVPLYCLEAITAIEDSHFLDHGGISVIGILRAAVKNIVQGGVKQGASTITQQLIKNYFLTSERTFKRKFTEIFMALILERYLEKDQIIENYLNVIYLGQKGPFEVRGYGAAAKFYFSKRIGDLDLSECALLAAIVNSPGRFNPRRHPERAQKRRNRVLTRMVELKMLDGEDGDLAKLALIRKPDQGIQSEPAPYFVQALQREIKQRGLDQEAGLRVFTTMSDRAQQIAQKEVFSGVKRLEAKNESIKKIKAEGKKLQALLISIDIESGGILALVGGRRYRETQYNRALDAHRQVGSIMKPLVYLAALESLNEEGQNYSPLSLIEDAPFTHKYEGQSWSPRNYNKEFMGAVPLFIGLKNSMNVVTAKLGIQVGLTAVVDVARRSGIKSKIEPLPSLTLGAFELFPLELIQSFSTIARMGVKKQHFMIESAEDFEGRVLFAHSSEPETIFAPGVVAELIGVMKQTLLTGTARSISLWRGFSHPAAGKTGTTSDTKDAWFLGFTPHILTLVWVGYDDNTAHGLTGSSGAVPLWTAFMKKFAAHFPQDDFTWPEGTSPYFLPEEALRVMVPKIKDHEAIDTQLILRSENHP